DYHHRFGHANRETVVNELRQRFFIKHLRAYVFSVMKDCQTCKIRKCQPVSPRMAPLPEARLTPHIRPFSTVGIDYLGPLEVVNARRKEKRYVAVFTCLVTRALHLEVAHGLSTEACIMAIRRFRYTRTTNFIGANNELRKQIAANHYSSADSFTDTHTTWRFNPPSAPHMGGVWERMVRSVKEAMNAFNDGGRLNDEILLTALADSESLINSRPLTYMPHASSDSEALTPNHFILGSSTEKKEQVRVLPHPAEALRNSYKRATELTDHFWDRLLKEYVPTLHRRSKWVDEGQQLEIRSLVFITEGAREEWLRAKVEEIFPGSDGRIRQAIVRTAHGKRLKRPVVKLAKIEAEIDKLIVVYFVC
uniref:Integrase zinc-binding domain-containing protein n=1 Tax=Anopheles dirus TaxID=7168 RepID=A0A182NQB9_9DIPT